MNAHCCHAEGKAESESGSALATCCENPRTPSPLGRLRGAVQWAVPGAVLVLMPKCPMCVAAYVALITGMGLSLSTAAHLRMLVLMLCFVTLAILAAKSAARRRRAAAL